LYNLVTQGNVKILQTCYQDNYPIGCLTEYYKFNDAEDALAVLRDLRQMKPKVLCQAENKYSRWVTQPG